MGGNLMHRSGRLLLVFIAAIVLAGCRVPQEDPAAKSIANASFDDVRRGDYAALQTLLGPQIKATPDMQAKLEQLKADIPTATPRGRETVGWNEVEQANGERVVDVSDQYDFGDRMIIWSTHLQKASSASPWLIEGLHLNGATASQLAANRFTLVGKSPFQDGFLLAVLLSPILMIAAVIKAIMTKGLEHKWLSVIAAFIGLCSFQMNWTTGQLFSQFFAINIIGAGITRAGSPFAPWILTMTLPVGALLVLTGVWSTPTRKPKRRPPTVL
jgi:hypothetical protein